MNTVATPRVVTENGRRFGRVLPTSQCTAISVIINEEAEFAAFAKQAERNRRDALAAIRYAEEQRQIRHDIKREQRARHITATVDRLVTVSLVAASVVCFHLLPWWSCIAPVVGAAWLIWRARK